MTVFKLMSRLSRGLLFAAIVAGASQLVGCGGGAPGADPDPSTLPVVVGIGASPAGTPITADATPVVIYAQVSQANKVLPGVVVSFAADLPELVEFEPANGTALTNSSGVAYVTVRAPSITAAGATYITASASGASASIGMSVGGASLTLTPLRLTSTSVSAYGTVGVETTVLANGKSGVSEAVTVKFKSSCAAQGLASIADAVTGPGGIAATTYIDKGCGKTDTVTATLGGSAQSATIAVAQASIGSIQFVSSVPADKSIVIKGQGGNGRSESALLTFKVLDQGNRPIANALVTFTPSTTAGGLIVDPTSARSSSDGTVTTTVRSGTTPTPVRVTATTTVNGTQLSTVSDTLSISTGLPVNRNYSLSLGASNIEGWEFDGTSTDVIATVGDYFGNPVPDGTTINFIASVGLAGSSDRGSCLTGNGQCTVTYRSGGNRPTNGRASLLSYVLGLEDYSDANGNNVYDAGETFSDLGDAYLDVNQNLVFDSGVDVPISIDGKPFSLTGDGVWGQAQIRRDSVVFLSRSSTPRVILTDTGFSFGCSAYSPSPPAGAKGNSVLVSFLLDDGNNNPMPSQTELSIVSSGGSGAGTLTPTKVRAIGRMALADVYGKAIRTSHSIVFDAPTCPSTGASVAVSFRVKTKTPLGVEAFADVCTINKTTGGLNCAGVSDVITISD